MSIRIHTIYGIHCQCKRKWISVDRVTFSPAANKKELIVSKLIESFKPVFFTLAIFAFPSHRALINIRVSIMHAWLHELTCVSKQPSFAKFSCYLSVPTKTMCACVRNNAQLYPSPHAWQQCMNEAVDMCRVSLSEAGSLPLAFSTAE